MAGFSKVYFVGSTGGFMGSDGLTWPFFQIMVGDGNRQWLEPVYDQESQRRDTADAAGSDATPRPIGDLQVLVPETPDQALALLDAVIAFFPAFFRSCPSLATVEAQLSGVTRLDFNVGRSVPSEWNQLRSEAYPLFKQLGLFEADLRAVDVEAIARQISRS